MSLVEILIYAGAFLVGRWLLSQFIKSQSSGSDDSKTAYLSAMRYVGFSIVFFSGGLFLGITIVEFNLLNIEPHWLVVRGMAVAVIGLYIAYKYPNFLKLSNP
jgi:hypothetical protein